ncbi:hypothetical protein L596_000713 [Steinernema carpocapsae]|uniref:Uncharacterized protein n=1 Tax=Steinernema carpocapsae TaxID=34508 RepID=A0A4U8UIX7_STECR|nr:hypothetical protein L596_000713 [Steinernema carpocapsae]
MPNSPLRRLRIQVLRSEGHGLPLSSGCRIRLSEGCESKFECRGATVILGMPNSPLRRLRIQVLRFEDRSATVILASPDSPLRKLRVQVPCSVQFTVETSLRMHHTTLSTLFSAVLMMIKEPSYSKRSFVFFDLLPLCCRRPGRSTPLPAFISAALDASNFNSGDAKVRSGFSRGECLPTRFKSPTIYDGWLTYLKPNSTSTTLPPGLGLKSESSCSALLNPELPKNPKMSSDRVICRAARLYPHFQVEDRSNRDANKWLRRPRQANSSFNGRRRRPELTQESQKHNLVVREAPREFLEVSHSDWLAVCGSDQTYIVLRHVMTNLGDQLVPLPNGLGFLETDAVMLGTLLHIRRMKPSNSVINRTHKFMKAFYQTVLERCVSCQRPKRSDIVNPKTPVVTYPR